MFGLTADGHVEGAAPLHLQVVASAAVDRPHEVPALDILHTQNVAGRVQDQPLAVGHNRHRAIEPGILQEGAFGRAGQHH